MFLKNKYTDYAWLNFRKLEQHKEKPIIEFKKIEAFAEIIYA